MWGATADRDFTGKAHYISIHAPRVGSDRAFVVSSTSSSAFQSTLPVWGATPPQTCLFLPAPDFNPRSPCGERQEAVPREYQALVISIHAPRVGSDVSVRKEEFYGNNFNPRSPCGERPSSSRKKGLNCLFQSTLPVWGATAQSLYGAAEDEEFQSTLPVWGATRCRDCIHRLGDISIHAPRVGSDQRWR